MADYEKLPLQIGVTGGIGSGKSIVCKVFSCLDVPVYNADGRAKWLTNNHAEIRIKVLELLGEKSYTEEGLYNSTYVASVVFKNEDLLKKLNTIIHPVVMKDTEKWVRERPDAAYVIKEAAIMNRAGNSNNLDYIIVVQAPVELRIKRILQRDNRRQEEIKAIIERQISDEDRNKIADFVIDNDEKSALLPQILNLHRLFVNR